MDSGAKIFAYGLIDKEKKVDMLYVVDTVVKTWFKLFLSSGFLEFKEHLDNKQLLDEVEHHDIMNYQNRGR